jgi:hypothetical protein
MKLVIKKTDGDRMLLSEFIENCESGFFIDYDGFGLYATETEITEIPDGIVKPSDVKLNKIKKGFTHIVWFNR